MSVILFPCRLPNPKVLEESLHLPFQDEHKDNTKFRITAKQLRVSKKPSCFPSLMGPESTLQGAGTVEGICEAGLGDQTVLELCNGWMWCDTLYLRGFWNALNTRSSVVHSYRRIFSRLTAYAIRVMFSLQKLLSLPVFVSTTLIAHALAAPQGFIDEDRNDSNFKYAAALTGGEECGDKELKAIRKGFDEMNKLFQAALNPDWTQEPELEFFGRRERISNYTTMIEGNLRRAAQYGNMEGDATRNPDIHVRCDDPNSICDEGNKKDGKHTVYNIGNEPHINFCKKYFDLNPLDEEVDDEAGDEQTRNDLLNYYNRATAWARMVMHISGIGTAVVVKPVANTQPNATSEWTFDISEGPMNTSVLAGVMDAHPDTNGPNNIRILKHAFGVTRAKLLATLSTQNAYDAANNAENYALYAQARYVIRKKKFFPNMPIMNFGNDIAVLTNGMIQDGDRKKFACFEMSDVVQRRQETNQMGSALPSSASATARIRHTQPVTLIWIILFCLGISAQIV